jgi:hypothetical protein
MDETFSVWEFEFEEDKEWTKVHSGPGAC